MRSFSALLKRLCLSQPLLFLAAGGTAFLIYVSVQQVLQRVGFRPYVALTMAYVLTLVLHFQLNRHVTFRVTARQIQLPIAASRYISVAIVNYAMTIAVVRLATAVGCRFREGMFVAVLVTTILSYCASRAWVFARAGVS